MARYSLIALIVLLGCSLAPAQFNIPEINKLKNIKLLKSYRYEVQDILTDFELQNTDEEDHTQRFSTENYSIRIKYSHGNCVDDSDFWNVNEWIVEEIEIEPDEEALPLKDLGFDLSKLTRERHFVDRPKSYVYFNKDLGLAFEVNENKVWKISMFGPGNRHVKSCGSDEARTFTSSKEWFPNSKLEERHQTSEAGTPNVDDLLLSASEIEFTGGNKQIHIGTIALDSDGDVLTYHYVVSGGKIIGEGPKVIWDLSNVLPGTYTITAGVDDGCGVCGKTRTKSVTIR